MRCEKKKKKKEIFWWSRGFESEKNAFLIRINLTLSKEEENVIISEKKR